MSTGDDSKFGVPESTIIDTGQAPGEESSPAPPVDAEKTAAFSLEELEQAGAFDDLGASDDAVDKTTVLESPLSGAAHAAPAAPPTPTPRLNVIEGADAGWTYDLPDGETLVGRGLDCDLVLNDASVSRRHFRLVCAGGVCRLIDLGSGNGTLVDDARADDIELVDGMVIEVGTTKLRLESSPASASPSVSASFEPEGDAERTMALDPSMVPTPSAPSTSPPAQAPSTPQFKSFGDDDDDGRTRVGNLAALELLPDWANRVAEQKEAIEVEKAERISDIKKTRRLGAVGMSLLVLVIAGGGFVLTDRLAGLGIIFEAGLSESELAELEKARLESLAKAKRVDELTADETAREALESAKAAFKAKEWVKARSAFKDALKVNSELQEAQVGLERARAELAASKAVFTARDAIEAERYKDALERLASIAEDSSYYPEAKELSDQTREALTAAAITDIQSLEDADDVAGALKRINEVLALVPNDGELLALQRELKQSATEQLQVAAVDPPATGDLTANSDKGTDPSTEPTADPTKAVTDTGHAKGVADAGTAPSPATTDAGTTPSKPEPSVADAGPTKTVDAGSGPTKTVDAGSGPAKSPDAGQTPPPTELPKANFWRGYKHYKAGDFTAAVDFFDGIARGKYRRRDRRKAKRLASRIVSFQTAYKAGMESARSFRTQSAIKQLKKARKLDLMIRKSYQTKIKQALAGQYAYSAGRAVSRKAFDKAGRDARKALKLDPGNASAKAIYEKVQKRASQWLSEARRLSRSNPDKAMSLLQRITSIFEKSDSRYREAWQLLNEIAERYDEE